ncbi:MAG TPA: thiamine phosphate synthase [Kofleriaceae bacterium]|nr:thiamine phosphate synthase [Kofleriaceae bacterium]
MHVVVITDRRLCADLIDRVRAISAISNVAFQVREKDLDGGALLALARAIIEAANGAPVWINDRVDVAVLAGAAGVHLPEAGMPIAEARRLAPTLKVAASRHSVASAREAADAGADVVQLGPLFPTPGKAPIDRAAFATKLGRATLVAVGGILGPDEARAAIRAGADAVAVIRAAWTADHPVAAIAAIADAVRAELAAR